MSWSYATWKAESDRQPVNAGISLGSITPNQNTPALSTATMPARNTSSSHAYPATAARASSKYACSSTDISTSEESDESIQWPDPHPLNDDTVNACCSTDITTDISTRDESDESIQWPDPHPLKDDTVKWAETAPHALDPDETADSDRWAVPAPNAPDPDETAVSDEWAVPAPNAPDLAETVDSDEWAVPAPNAPSSIDADLWATPAPNAQHSGDAIDWAMTAPDAQSPRKEDANDTTWPDLLHPFHTDNAPDDTESMHWSPIPILGHHLPYSPDDTNQRLRDTNPFMPTTHNPIPVTPNTLVWETADGAKI